MIDLKHTVVKIKSGTETGTGFIVDKPNGLILTCAHVIKDKTDIRVYCFDVAANAFTQELTASLQAHEAANDIALLKAQKTLPSSMVGLPLYSCQKSQGQAFETYGFLNTNGLLIEGRISEVDNPNQYGVPRIVLSNAAAIQGGISGAPILDTSQSAIVGIVRSVPSNEPGTPQLQGYAYGISIDRIAQQIPQVKISSRVLKKLTPPQNQGKRLLGSFKQIKVQYEAKKYQNHNAKVRTFLVNVPEGSAIDTTWFWSVSLLKGKHFEYVKAGNNYIESIEDLLAGLLGLKGCNISTSGKLDPDKLQALAGVLVKRLAAQDIYLVIDHALALIEKDTASHKINFLTQIWQPISQAVEKAQPKHCLCLLLVHNQFASSQHHHYTTDMVQSAHSKTPLLLEYWGFQHKKDAHKPTDQDELEEWVERHFAPNFGTLEDIQNPQGTSFFELYQHCRQDYEQACACGNIEKLFHKICAELGYTFIKNNPIQGNNTLWQVIPIQRDLPSLGSV